MRQGRGLPVLAQSLVVLYRAEGHDVAALSGVDLAVPAGGMLAVVGPSGSGKSTLLSVFGGLVRASAGKASIGDADLAGMTESDLDRLRAGQVALMLQGAHRNLLPYLTPRQNVEHAQRFALRRGREVPDVAEIVEMVGITDRADRPLTDLTPGFYQLTAVAAAVAGGPGVLLADEPTSQLHHTDRDRVLESIRRINEDYGTTVLVVTHDQAVADFMGRALTIRDGRVGGEDRAGQQFAVVASDGSVPLPAEVFEELPAGSLLRVVAHEGGILLVPQEASSDD